MDFFFPLWYTHADSVRLSPDFFKKPNNCKFVSLYVYTYIVALAVCGQFLHGRQNQFNKINGKSSSTGFNQQTGSCCHHRRTRGCAPCTLRMATQQQHTHTQQKTLDTQMPIKKQVLVFCLCWKSFEHGMGLCSMLSLSPYISH